MKKNRPRSRQKFKQHKNESDAVQKPLKGVVALGQEGNTIHKVSDTIDIPNFDALKIATLDLENIEQKIRIYHTQLTFAGSVERTTVLLSKINALWLEVLDNYFISKARHVEISPLQEFYVEQYKAIERLLPSIAKRVKRAYIKLLNSPYLEAINLQSGKLFFSRLNADYFMQRISYKDLFSDEQILRDRFWTEKSKLEKLEQTTAGIKQTDILFENILQKRAEIADALEFKSFIRISCLQDSYQNLSTEVLRAFRENIKRYLLPIHKHNIRQLGLDANRQMGQESFLFFEETNMRSYFEQVEGNVKEYYERYFGEEDWELRHIEDILKEDSRIRISEEHLIASPTFMYQDSPEKFFMTLCSVIDKSIDRSKRGFLNQLGRKSYIRLDFEHIPNDLEVHYLAMAKAPLLTGTYKRSSAFVATFIQKVGELYAFSHETSTDKQFMHALPLPYLHKRFWNLGMEVLALEHMDEFFPNEGILYGQERMHKIVRSILIKTMIDEFEYYIYKDREMKMLERTALWQQLREEYSMEYYLDELFWRDEHVMRRLLDKPGLSIIENLADFSVLNLWLLNREDKKLARDAYQSFCELGLQEDFVTQIKAVDLDDPSDKALCKRLAFSIADYLEEEI